MPDPPAPPAGPPRKPVPQPAKRRVVHGLLVGAALGGTLGAVNLAVSDVGDKLTEARAPGDPEPDGWHATYARYTGWCVFGGGGIGLLGGAAAVMRDRYRGGRETPPAGFAG